MTETPKPSVGVGYPLGQLLRALETAAGHADPATRERARAKVERWKLVLEGMVDGTISVGSRTPVAGAPAWATLEVAHGGFATGFLLAGGPLLQHERMLAARLGASLGSRLPLNLHALGDDGRADLRDRIHDGRYRVSLPEEGALLVVAWLLDHDEPDLAAVVLDAITPLFDRLRFYPVPSDRPLGAVSGVRVATAGEVAAALLQRRPNARVVAMNEALSVWAPLYDRAVALFLETVDGDTPRLATTPDGALARRPDGQPIVEGGWPCRRYPDDWPARALALHAEYARLDASVTRSRRSARDKAAPARLRRFLEPAARAPRTLGGRDVAMIRNVLAGFVTRYGAPGSEAHARLRAEQAELAARPLHASLARVLAERLRAVPAREERGVASVDAFAGAVTAEEAVRAKTTAGAALPEALLARVERCLEASVEELVERDVLTSAEAIARVLPQLTSQLAAAGIADLDLARLYAALYEAFRQRRSVLLLDLAHQVRFGELPWVSVLQKFRTVDLDARSASRAALERVLALCLTHFPHAILPNKLLAEVRGLAADAGLDVPVVDELAADIFVGAFSEKFLRSAQVTARMLRGSLYERYYALPFDRVLGIDDVRKEARGGAPHSPGLAALCVELAAVGPSDRWSVARNGKIIEQAQLLTTHNLAPLFGALGLHETLAARLREMADACFAWIVRRHSTSPMPPHAELITLKNTAYAWRQMIFFASLLDRAALDALVADARAKLGHSPSPRARRRLDPALRGLELVARGGRFDAEGRGPDGARRFLGWTTGKHWMLELPPEA